MEHRQDNNATLLSLVIDAVRESTSGHTPGVFANDGIRFGLFCGECHAPFDLCNELYTKIWTLSFVSGRSRQKFSSCGMTELYGQSHLLMRLRASALSSSQETTSSGFASWNAVLLRSNAEFTGAQTSRVGWNAVLDLKPFSRHQPMNVVLC